MDAAAEANRSSPVYESSDSSVELCYCGSRLNHSWPLTSQCDDLGYSSSSWGIERLPPSLVEEIEKYSDTYKAESDSSSRSKSSSWGIETLPPSLVEEIEEYNDTHKAESDSSSSDTIIISPKTVTECTECKEKEAEVKRLKRVTQKLKIRIRQLESTLETENIPPPSPVF